MSMSILSEKFLGPILATAKDNLRRDGVLYPVIFVRDQGGRVRADLVQLSTVPAEKQAYMRRLGVSLHTRGIIVTEAVLLSEGWFVNAAKVAGALAVARSQHPARQEAITLMGRNAKGTLMSSVVQLFGRDPDNKPVWGDLAIAMYNEKVGPDQRAVCLLDYLFPDPKGGEYYGTGQTLYSQKRYQA